MSNTFHRPIAQRARTLLTPLAMCAALIAALIFVNNTGTSSWWPRTGEAFAASPSPQPTPDNPGPERCRYIIGPAHNLCLRGRDSQPPPPQAQTSAPGRNGILHAALLLLPLAGVATITTHRRRTR
ncbi:hypothetical protein [Streptomyces sp. NPDC058326]|uniref:hypothetical protein n=1 Tax=Streptomyces sp. NPDC058326 TaxID=3346447 RepID=UPI0036EEAED7